MPGLTWGVILIVARLHLGRHPDRYAVSLQSVILIVTRSNLWSVILIVTRSHLESANLHATWSHLERHLDRYVGRIILIVTWYHLEVLRDSRSSG